MARTLEQLDADLATAEAAIAQLSTRVTNLTNAGQALTQRVNNLEQAGIALNDKVNNAIDRAIEIKRQLDPLLDLNLAKVRDKLQKLGREIALQRAPNRIEDRTQTVRLGNRTVRRALRD